MKVHVFLVLEDTIPTISAFSSRAAAQVAMLDWVRDWWRAEFETSPPYILSKDDTDKYWSHVADNGESYVIESVALDE